MTAAVLFLLVFCGGFSIMSIELLGGRILAPYFGSSIHVWGSLITVFMLALSLGYLLGGHYSLKKTSLKRFGALFLLAAVAILPLVIVGDVIMDSVFGLVDDPRYGSLLAALLMFFLPTVVLGAVSPYAVQLMVRDRAHSGQIAGRLYFASTFGSAIGTLLTSFYLVLYFEVNQILLVIFAGLILCGLLALAHDRQATKI